jgi:hypothetical protein
LSGALSLPVEPLGGERVLKKRNFRRITRRSAQTFNILRSSASRSLGGLGHVIVGWLAPPDHVAQLPAKLVRGTHRLNQRPSKGANHCRRFPISAIIQDVVEHVHPLSECSKERWIALAKYSCDAERKGFGTHLNLR